MLTSKVIDRQMSSPDNPGNQIPRNDLPANNNVVADHLSVRPRPHRRPTFAMRLLLPVVLLLSLATVGRAAHESPRPAGRASAGGHTTDPSIFNVLLLGVRHEDLRKYHSEESGGYEQIAVKRDVIRCELTKWLIHRALPSIEEENINVYAVSFENKSTSTFGLKIDWKYTSDKPKRILNPHDYLSLVQRNFKDIGIDKFDLVLTDLGLQYPGGCRRLTDALIQENYLKRGGCVDASLIPSATRRADLKPAGKSNLRNPYHLADDNARKNSAFTSLFKDLPESPFPATLSSKFYVFKPAKPEQSKGTKSPAKKVLKNLAKVQRALYLQGKDVDALLKWMQNKHELPRENEFKLPTGRDAFNFWNKCILMQDLRRKSPYHRLFEHPVLEGYYDEVHENEKKDVISLLEWMEWHNKQEPPQKEEFTLHSGRDAFNFWNKCKLIQNLRRKSPYHLLFEDPALAHNYDKIHEKDDEKYEEESTGNEFEQCRGNDDDEDNGSEYDSDVGSEYDEDVGC